MFYKKILIAINIVTILKLDCTEANMLIFDDISCRSIACQTEFNSIENYKSNAPFVHGNFNSEYKFSKTEIAQLTLISLAVGVESTPNILAFMAYSAGEFVINLANILLKTC